MVSTNRLLNELKAQNAALKDQYIVLKDEMVQRFGKVDQKLNDLTGLATTKNIITYSIGLNVFLVLLCFLNYLR